MIAHRATCLLAVMAVGLSAELPAHDIPVLVAARLLKPLGHPPANWVKYFSTALLFEMTEDATWLAKMTNAIHDYWRVKNARKSPTAVGLATKPPDLKL